MENSNIYLLWAKANNGEKPYKHLLIFHMIDVMAVTQTFFKDSLPQSLQVKMASDLGIISSSTVAWISFLAGCHDIGKASPLFQGKRPEAKASLRGLGYDFPSTSPNPPHHSEITEAILSETLPQFSWNGHSLPKKLIRRCAKALGGHHGKFPATTRDISSKDLGRDNWSTIRNDLLNSLQNAAGLSQQEAPQKDDQDHGFFMLFAGLVAQHKNPERNLKPLTNSKKLYL